MNDENILDYYEIFLQKFIENIEDNEWELDDKKILEWLELNRINCHKIFLTPRFERIGDFIFLDNKKLGKHFEFNHEFNISDDKSGIIAHCDFSEIFTLYAKELPKNIIFDFVDSVRGTDEYKISDTITFSSIKYSDDSLKLYYWLFVSLEDYEGFKNSKITVNEFLEQIKNVFKNTEIIYNKIEDGGHIVEFCINIQEINQILQDTVINTNNIIFKLYDKTIDRIENNSEFEAIFNFPEEYQSILKPYMLYFEEFLNDLCIESDVSIRKEGLDTILSVEPKNKDEALEKIADALKLYISAPIVASDVSLEEKLQMQTALQKLHAQCTHLESQLVLKQATLTEQHKQLQTQQNVIDETKRVLIEAGIKPERISVNNTMLIDSLKEVNFNQQKMSKNTFWKSIKSSIKVPSIFEATLEISREQFEKDK